MSNMNWIGRCSKCDIVLKSAHFSGVCKNCRTNKCRRCQKPFRASAKSSAECSTCRSRFNNEELKFNAEEHYI